MAKQKRPVNANDHIAAIARRPAIDYKKFQTLWDENADLKSKRKNPNILFHGVKDPTKATPWKHPPDEYEYEDDPADRTENAPTDSHTSFSAGATKVYLRLRVLDGDYAPFNAARYELEIGGIPVDPTQLTPDEKGIITVEFTDSMVPAEGGLLKVFYKPPATPSDPTPAEICIQFTLSIGRLDPIDDTKPAGDNYLSGAQQRLNNLGLYAGEVDGISGPTTESAIRRFQKLCDITPAEEALGKPIAGPKTLDWLEKIHDKPGKPADAKTPVAQSTPVTVTPIVAVSATPVTVGQPVETPLQRAENRFAAARVRYENAKKAKQDAYKNRDRDIGAYTQANQEFIAAEKELKSARNAVNALGGSAKLTV